jgi:hypothetical protein
MRQCDLESLFFPSSPRAEAPANAFTLQFSNYETDEIYAAFYA